MSYDTKELRKAAQPECVPVVLNDWLSALLHACDYIVKIQACPTEAGLKMPEGYDCAAECVGGKEHLCWKIYFINMGGR